MCRMSEAVVTVTLSNSLSATDAAALGITEARYYAAREEVVVPVSQVQRIIAAGYTTINPADREAIDALLGTAYALPEYPDPVPVYVNDIRPLGVTGKFVWFQTNVGAGGIDIHVEDGS